MSKIKIYILFFLLNIFTISKIIGSDFCQKIKCDSNLSPDTCVKVDSKISLLNPCSSSKICDIDSEDPLEDSYCIERNPIPFKKLPSLPCNSSEECLSDKCMLEKCVGTDDGDSCNNAFDCNYGKTCRKNNSDDLVSHCLDPLEEGEKCQLDTDCELHCGCMKGICTKYFSLDNYEETGGLDYNSDFNFCKSGYVNEVGICMNISLKNQITECSDESPCEYDYFDENNEKKSLTIHSNCLCGYNPFGKKYCLIGSGNYNFTKHPEKLKNYHFNNDNCHLSERTSQGCQKDLIFGSEEKLEQIYELINAKYWAKANNRLIDSPECVYNVEIPEYNRTLDINTYPEPIPEGKCARYFCNNSIKGGICASSDYISEFEINVTLSDVCDDIKCNLNGEPNDVFYNKTNVKGTCSSKILNKRYPGEKCDIDSQCVYPLNNPSSQFHECEDGECKGMEEGDICEDNSWCKVGLYCDKHSGKCKEQLEEGDSCIESKDCENNLICYNGKCREIFSVEDGNKVPETESYEIQRKFCKSGEVMDNTCVSFNDLDGMKLRDNEYRKCDYNTYCEYKVIGLQKGRKKYVKCGCGYNSEGQGYCPHYHDYTKDDWEEYREQWRDKSDNGCHTESRYNCYEYDERNKLRTYINKIEYGHLFYKSVGCAKNVLKGNNISINKLLFIFLGFITFSL